MWRRERAAILQLAQDRSSLGGKILRINPDGSIPSDNPDPASPVWSFGHRNIQGLAWDSAGRLWATEYGANRLDELNLIRPGGNYGWPMAEGRADTPGLIDPVIQWGTGEASPSGLAYFGGALWVACLRGQRLYQIPVGADGSLGDPGPLFVGQYGRLRTVAAAPDGTLWFTTSNRDGRGVPARRRPHPSVPAVARLTCEGPSPAVWLADKANSISTGIVTLAAMLSG